ncbi:MAG TPA: dephospho-CoA kinase [Candidatus Hydrogenedens sp.]|nr:dephospho-CoA kinase [Candidatus Hydrogenedens sp.]
MKVIGLTGGIASGKTEVANILKKHGFYVIDSDEIGHEVLFNEKVKEKIIEIFGTNILTDGQIDRRKLGEIIFSNPEKRQIINELIHPLVINEIANRVQKAEEEGYNVVIVESAIIGEDEITQLQWLHGLILVLCSKELRIQRLMSSRNLSYDEALSRINSQKDPDEKKIFANWIIYNNGDMNTLEENVKRVIEEIKIAI